MSLARATSAALLFLMIPGTASALESSAPEPPSKPSLVIGVAGGLSYGEAVGLPTTGWSGQGWAGRPVRISRFTQVRPGAVLVHDRSQTELGTEIFRTRAGARVGVMFGDIFEVGGGLHFAFIDVTHRRHLSSLTAPGGGLDAFVLVRPYRASSSLPLVPFFMASLTGDAFAPDRVNDARPGNRDFALFDVTAQLSLGVEIGSR